MKIIFASDADLPSTSAHAVATLHMTSAIGAIGHDVTLLAPWHRRRARDHGAMRAELGLHGPFTLRYLPYVSIAGRLRGSYLTVATAAARLSGALVYTRNVRLALMAARAGSRVIIETHQTFASQRWLDAARELALHPRLARWVFISKRLQELVGTDVDLPTQRCIVAHSAVDLERFIPPLESAEARRVLGLPLDRTLIVHAGHMYEGRGVEDLLEAAAAVPGAQLILLGGTESDVARLSGHNPESARVLGHRPLSEVPTWLFAADILVMPYTSATTTSDGKTRSIEWASPMKMFEYLAAGRAIVATRFPGVAEVLIDGRNARLIEADQPAALRTALSDLAKDPSLRASLGAQAHTDARAYSWQERARRVLDGL